jgi:hypothetical protein
VRIGLESGTLPCIFESRVLKLKALELNARMMFSISSEEMKLGAAPYLSFFFCFSPLRFLKKEIRHRESGSVPLPHHTSGTPKYKDPL